MCRSYVLALLKTETFEEDSPESSGNILKCGVQSIRSTRLRGASFSAKQSAQLAAGYEMVTVPPVVVTKRVM